MLRGNASQDIFFNEQDRDYFGELLLEGLRRFEQRIHGFCFMDNHVHLVVQVGRIELSRIIQNVSFRYTHWINKNQKQMGHLFQGRYQAILVDEEQYLLELVRYLHLNPVRAGIIKHPDLYFWSSHQVYKGKRNISWIHTECILSQFSRKPDHARRLYFLYIEEALGESRQPEFQKGNRKGRLLGDDNFAEKALRKAGERVRQALCLDQLVEVVCHVYQINEAQLIAKGKTRKASEARTVIAWIVRESENLTLVEWGVRYGRDGVTLSNAIRVLLKRAEKDAELKKRMKETQKTYKHVFNGVEKHIIKCLTSFQPFCYSNLRGRSLLKTFPLERMYHDARCGSLMFPWTAETCLDRLGSQTLYEKGESD